MHEKMKILHIINDADVGGAQTLIEQLAGRSLEHSWECHLLVLGERGTLSGRLDAVMKSVSYMDFQRSSYRLDKLIVGVIKHIKAVQPNVVHSHLLQSDLAAIGASLFVRVPLVSTVHTTGTSTQDPLRTRILARVLGYLSRFRVAAAVACGDGAAAYMRQMGYGTVSSTIPNGVSVSPSFPRDEFERKGQFLNLARFHPMKDHTTLLKAIALQPPEVLPQTRLALAGTDIDRNNEVLCGSLMELAVCEQVSLLGVVDDVSLLLQQSDALIISSSYGEALPMAGIEALAMGVPVIATDVGDCKSLTVDPRLLVTPRDSLALSEAVTYLRNLSDEDYAELCHKSWQSASENYSVEETASRYAVVYSQVQERISA